MLSMIPSRLFPLLKSYPRMIGVAGIVFPGTSTAPCAVATKVGITGFLRSSIVLVRRMKLRQAQHRRGLEIEAESEKANSREEHMYECSWELQCENTPTGAPACMLSAAAASSEGQSAYQTNPSMHLKMCKNPILTAHVHILANSPLP